MTFRLIDRFRYGKIKILFCYIFLKLLSNQMTKESEMISATISRSAWMKKIREKQLTEGIALSSKSMDFWKI